MITWITDFLGTCAFSKIPGEVDFKIVDVRDFVDSHGNERMAVKKRLSFIQNILKNKNKVVICCDYGMSRSNAFAAGALAKHQKISFDAALETVLSSTKAEIKMDILKVVRSCVEKDANKEKSTSERSILILGASGTIGRVVTPLLKSEFKVFHPSRSELDITTSPIELQGFCVKNNITHILNLTSPGVRNSYAAFGEGLGMLRNILEVLKCQSDIHLTYLSAGLVFSGYSSNGLICTEETPVYPDGLYSELLFFSESLAEYYLKKYSELKISTLRLSPLYGSGSKPKFLLNFIGKSLYNEDIHVHEYNNGFPRIQLMHVDDIAAALKKWFSVGVKPGLYHVGGTCFLTTHNIAEKIIKNTKSTSRIKIRKIEMDTANIFLDAEKFSDEFDWFPKNTLDSSISKMVKDFMEDKI